jgi:glutamyl-tRNA synthetase
MTTKAVRVRFAPSPTGLMHLGGVRIALFNYLFARKNKGLFILRIEDTDAERNFDPGAVMIMQDISWLNLTPDEGPEQSGPYAPYFQSQRSSLYQEKLDSLFKNNYVYRCFCTVEELERKRTRQIALKVAPRYDRTCLALSADQINQRLSNGTPFIWRLKVDTTKSITITDLARGPICFDLANFADFPLTRQDGSFTFLFVNCIDDILMKISHVIRGEDHLSNTANQAMLYNAFKAEIPLFWHMPIICNTEGKKLSKRDFGFSLKDLQQAGFLPEAICNYLAIIGGGSFHNEIMSLDELIECMNFEHIPSTGAIRYDVEKLKWVNHQWIVRYTPEQLHKLAMPFLTQAYPQAATLEKTTQIALINAIRTELSTLKDCARVLYFYFEEPTITQESLMEHIPTADVERLTRCIQEAFAHNAKPEQFLDQLKANAKQHNLSVKLVFMVMRLFLSGMQQGSSVKEMIELLGTTKTESRIKHGLSLLKK